MEKLKKNCIYCEPIAQAIEKAKEEGIYKITSTICRECNDVLGAYGTDEGHSRLMGRYQLLTEQYNTLTKLKQLLKANIISEEYHDWVSEYVKATTRRDIEEILNAPLELE